MVKLVIFAAGLMVTFWGLAQGWPRYWIAFNVFLDLWALRDAVKALSKLPKASPRPLRGAGRGILRAEGDPRPMRFPTIFRRRVGEPPDPVPQEWLEQDPNHIKITQPSNWRNCLIPELGSDKLPEKDQLLPRRDNLHESRLVNVNGFPSQRICVGYQGPQGAPNLIAEMHLFDETSSSWFLVPPCKDDILEPGKLTYFDPPCLLDHSRAKKHPEDESHQSGSLEVLLIVRALSAEGYTIPSGTIPPGVYTFVIGTDVSNPG